MANMAQAIRMALHYGEENLEVTEIFGEDVGAPLGGVFTATQGLKAAWNSPLDERGIVGMAMGIGLAGERCVAEIQFCDYIFNTIDLLKLIGNTYWSCNGQYNLPIVIMTPVGSGIHGSIYHSHSLDALASRLVGWKIVMPSNPLDAYGLMISAIKDPNPVLYLKPKSLMRTKGRELIPGEPEDEKLLKEMIDAPLGENRTQWNPKWPELKEYEVPIGSAKVINKGNDLTLITYGRHVSLASELASQLHESEGSSVEVIDLRSIYPYDWPLIKTSIAKTGKVLFVNEDTDVTNFCEHLAYRTTQELFYSLIAPPRVLAGKNLPGIGLHNNLEQASVPQKEDILAEIKSLLSEEP